MNPPQNFKMFYRHNLLSKSEEAGYVKSQTEKGYLLKYFPKYYKKISLDKVDAPTIAKIKGLKRLHHFQAELKSNKPQKLSLVLLQKFRKDLRALPQLEKDFSHRMKRWYGSKFREVRYFSGIESIEFPKSFFADPFESAKGDLKNSKRSVNQILIYLAHTKNLKNIRASFQYKVSQFLLNNQNLFKKSKGKLNIVPHLSARILSDFALQSSPLSQNIARMNISRCTIDELKEITTVVEILQGLEILNIFPHQYVKETKIPQAELEQLSLNFYKVLEASSKLRKLSLYVNELILEWLNNFALPKSLQVLKIGLTSSKSKKCLEESHPVLENFCLRIQELPLLDTLCLGLTDLRGDDPIRIWDFAVNLLQGVRKLSYLKLGLPTDRYEPEENPVRALDCALIFEGIQHLMPVLQGLHLDFITWKRGATFSPSPKFRFPNLYELKFNGYFSLPFDIRQILMMMVSGKDNSLRKQIKIKRIIIKSQEDAEALLKNINHIARIESHINLKLHVEFSEDLIMTLVDVIKGIRYIEGLALYISLKEAMRFTEVLEAVKDHHSRLDYLEVRDTDRISKREHSYIFKRGILVKKFNDNFDEI